MPITYNREQGWHFQDLTEEERQALLTIGKKLMIDNIAANYTTEYFNRFLSEAPDSKFYSA